MSKLVIVDVLEMKPVNHKHDYRHGKYCKRIQEYLRVHILKWNYYILYQLKVVMMA
jgi:hypothetical protein